MEKKHGRKEFFKKLGLIGLGAAAGGTLLAACGGGESDTPQNNGGGESKCDDLSGLTESQVRTREQFEYVSQTPKEGKFCDNCALWIKPKEGEFCGGCQIVAGPIHPKGYCNQWIETSKS